ncbi:hypothetical protein [Paracoccus sp. NSM]|uniref:hypothetical protein n=1 Tax=Paracoccus sp. NSM TaxID=3457784 RepID=UPI004035840D
MIDRDEVIEVEVAIVSESPRGLLLSLPGKPRHSAEWAPKAQVEILDRAAIKPTYLARMTRERARRTGLVKLDPPA